MSILIIKRIKKKNWDSKKREIRSDEIGSRTEWNRNQNNNSTEFFIRDFDDRIRFLRISNSAFQFWIFKKFLWFLIKYLKFAKLRQNIYLSRRFSHITSFGWFLYKTPSHIKLYLIIPSRTSTGARLVRRVNRNKAPFSPRDLYIFYMGLVYKPM